MEKKLKKLSKNKMSPEERGRFQENIRFLYAKMPMKDYGYAKMVKVWEAKIEERAFPMALNGYQDVFRTKEPIPQRMTVTSAVRAIEVINFYLEDPFEARDSRGDFDDRACFEKFIKVKFTESNCPKIRTGKIESHYEKFIQDYYVYMPTESKHFTSVGFLSMYMTEEGVQAYLLCHLRRTDVLFDLDIWNIFKDYDAKNVEERFWSKFKRDDGGQPIGRLYASSSITFNPNYMTIDFTSVGNSNLRTQIFLDISSCTTKDTPDTLLYQFGCGAITHILGPTIGFSASHVLLVNAMGDTEEREYALSGKRSEKFLERYLSPIGVPYIKEAIDECGLIHFSCNSKQTADFYRWNKAQNMEELRKKKEDDSRVSKKDLAELIIKLQKMYETIEE